MKVVVNGEVTDEQEIARLNSIVANPPSGVEQLHERDLFRMTMTEAAIWYSRNQHNG